MFEMRLMIGLSRLLDDYIVREIVISKFTTVNLQDVGTTPMQDCSETIVCAALVVIWINLENVKNLGTAEKLDIYIFYHYNILIVRLNNVDYAIVLWVKI